MFFKELKRTREYGRACHILDGVNQQTKFKVVYNENQRLC